MAFKAKHLFLVVLLSQVILLAIYLVARDAYYTNIVFLDIFYSCGVVHHNASWTSERSPSSKSEVFQPIGNRLAWLYSAFYDHVAAQEGRPLVRIFGVVKRSCTLTITCTFSTESVNLMSTGVITLLPGEHGVDHPPSYLECPLPSNVRPTHVSVTFWTTDKPTNRLKILYPGPRIRNFTVCYSVLHSGYNKTTQLIESIELNRILGAEHFMVYNYSISPEVSQILSRYQEDGLVTVLQWSTPTLDSWYFAQMTALNDCFYRNRNTSRFVVVVDTDELIVPRYHYTWMEFLHIASPQDTDVSIFMNSPEPSNKRQSQTACFIVQSTFFYVNSTPNWSSLPSQFSFSQEEQNNIIKYNILTLSQTERTDRIFQHTVRSKYIARPELVYISGVHEVHALTSSKKCLFVNETLALTHHYREIDFMAAVVKDFSALKFKKSLYPRILKQIKLVHKIYDRFSSADSA